MLGSPFSKSLEPLDLVFGGVNRSVLRQVEIDNQLRPVRGREELLLDEAVAVERGGEEPHSHGNDEPAGAHAEDQRGAEQPHKAAGFGMAITVATSWSLAVSSRR